MTQLFTVHMKRKQLVSICISKKETRQEERLIEVTFADLPYSTAKAYKDTFPEAEVRIVRQAVSVGDKRRTSVRMDGERSAARAARPEKTLPKPRSQEEPAAAVISTGSYADVVNSMMEKSA